MPRCSPHTVQTFGHLSPLPRMPSRKTNSLLRGIAEYLIGFSNTVYGSLQLPSIPFLQQPKQARSLLQQASIKKPGHTCDQISSLNRCRMVSALQITWIASFLQTSTRSSRGRISSIGPSPALLSHIYPSSVLAFSTFSEQRVPCPLRSYKQKRWSALG